MGPGAILIALDDWLLDRVTQPAVDFCGRRWGWSFIKIGETMCAVALAVYVLFVVSVAWNAATAISVPLAALIVAAASTMTLWNASEVVRGVERAKRVQDGINWNRLHCFGMRIGNLVNMLFISYLDYLSPPPIMSGSLALFTAGFYVLSVHRPPPKEQRARVPAAALPEAV